MKYCLQSRLQPCGSQEGIRLPQVEPGSRVPEGCCALLLAWDFVLPSLFWSSPLSVNAFCARCSAVTGVLSWPERTRDWTGAVAFSCSCPFGGGGRLPLKSQRGWCLCRDTSGLTRAAGGWRRACVAVRWSLQSRGGYGLVPGQWRWPTTTGQKQFPRDAPCQNRDGEWVSCMVSGQLDKVSAIPALWKLF